MIGKSRKRQLLVPIAAMTLGALILLIVLGAMVIDRFDQTAVAREQSMVASGFDERLRQLDEVVVPQVDWDKAVAKVDRTMDLTFADIDFGHQLFTFYGFTYCFFVDGDGQVTYSVVGGKHEPTGRFTPFWPIARQLLAPIREAEIRRGPIRAHAENKGPITRPIQAHGIARIDGKVYVVMASLVQPDLGQVQPKGPRATVLITAKPIDRAMLHGLAVRFLLDRLELVASPPTAANMTYFPLRAPDGTMVAALAWTPRKPGTALLQRMMLPLVGGMVLLVLAGWTITRRSGVIVDELIASEMRARHLAYHDPLTRLPNRAMLFERLPVMVSELSARRPLLAVMCIDLDRFKEVNDTLGHQAGDELLRAVADRLRALVSEEAGAFSARLGGDEFVLIAPAFDQPRALVLAERCLGAMIAPVDSEFGRLDVGCSIGVAIIDGKPAKPSLVLRQADLALYQAKARGRGCVTVYVPEMEIAEQSRRQLETNLRIALDQGAFRMVYQPQVDAGGHVHAYEALLRWHHPELGDIPPATFIPLAEECGLILGIGEFVVRRVLEETRDWLGVRVAINVSAIQLRAPGFAARMTQLIAAAGADPGRYDIELTETALLTNTQTTNDNYMVLRRLGFGMVLDDFGTGNSSLSLLHRFRVDKIKIDRSFVADLGINADAETLVSAIIKLARTFNLGVIAEGVETEAQKARLIKAGCKAFQGYLTGRPVPADVIAPLYGTVPDVLRSA